ncbi:glycosyltransferase family 39 protein [Kitasatospora camelliae]|uniref:Glycosyltransferase family 39 protein n=1 Tax=Kitasatospora camelliae TaxID=3156397 RepID=A0AAU8JUF7_9ACTN
MLRLVWLWPALATLAVGLYRIGTPVLWHDELATVSVINRPVGSIVAMLRNVDAVHGVYYLSLHGWATVFGHSPTALRMPGVLAMTAAAACVALTGRRLFGARAGLAGGLAFALLPTVGRYAQEIRSYAFVVLAASAAALLLLRALERPTVLRWAGYAAAMTAAGYVHLVSLVVVLPHALAVALDWWRSRNRRVPLGFVLAFLTAVAAVYPLIRLGERQAARQIGWILVPTGHDLAAIWAQILGGTMVTAAVVVLAALSFGGGNLRSAVLATVMAAVPVLAIWEISRQASVSYFMPKYLFFTLPAWAVVAGAGLAAVRWRGTVTGLAALALVALPDVRAMHQPLSHAAYTYPVEVTWFTPLDYRAAAAIVEQGYRPGDGIAFGQQRYALWWGVDTGTWYYLPNRIRPRDVLAGLSARERDDLWPTSCGDPAGCLGPEPRIWLVSKDDGTDPMATVSEAAEGVLRQRYATAEVHRVSGMTVALLVRR